MDKDIFYISMIIIVFLAISFFIPKSYNSVINDRGLTGNVIKEVNDCVNSNGDRIDCVSDSNNINLKPTGFICNHDGVCSKLCESDDDCSFGKSCCQTSIGGLCDINENCQQITEFVSAGKTLQDYVIMNKEKPTMIKNIALKTFWLPLIFAFLLVFGIIYSANRKALKH